MVCIYTSEILRLPALQASSWSDTDVLWGPERILKAVECLTWEYSGDALDIRPQSVAKV